MDFENLDTKDRILFTALQLFSGAGYENVSMRDIADAIGIKASSIYNHYAGKAEILDDCYNFYEEHRHDTRLNKEQYAPIMRDGTKEEVMAALNYAFSEDILYQVFQGYMLVVARIYTDKRAREIFISEINQSMEYLVEFFAYGVETGRINDFNIPAIASICLSARLFTGQSATFSPDELPRTREAEIDVFKELVNMVPFKY